MRNTPWLRALGAAALLGLLAVAFTPLPNHLARWADSPVRIGRADAIVVLAASVGSNGMLSDTSLRRAVHGIRLYRQGYAPLLVLSGSPASPGRPDEALVRAGLARDLGVAPEAILTARGGTTRDEAARLRSLAAGRPIRTVLLVSNAEHLPRARSVFEQAGFEVLPAPADAGRQAHNAADRLALTWRILGELAARLYYRVAGYSRAGGAA